MSLSQGGTLAYLDTGRIRGQRLAWRDRSGKILEQSGHLHEAIMTVTLAADGNRAVVIARDGVWIYDVRRFVRTRFQLGSDSPDGRMIFAFLSRSGDEIYYSVFKSPTQTEVFVRPVDGNGEARPVPAPAGFKVAEDRTADGRYIVYGVVPGGTAGARVTNSIWLWRTDGAGGKGEAIYFSQNTEDEAAVVLSPNNRYVAYTSSASGRIEVYIRPFPEGPGRWQVSVNGGEAPAWSANGKELFYKEGNTLMRVSVATSGTFAPAAPEPLFEHPTLRLVEVPVARYATSDGQRFLTIESDRDRATPVVRLIENWLSEFTRAAPKRSG
jgi:hypothetical protein